MMTKLSEEVGVDFNGPDLWKPEFKEWFNGFRRTLNSVHDNPLYFTERGPVRKSDLPQGLEEELHALMRTITEARLELLQKVEMRTEFLLKKYDP
jgi:hypothetical protein